MLCNELVSTGDVHRDGNSGATRLGTGDRCHGALSEPLGLDGAVDGALVFGRRRGGRCRAGERRPRLLHGDGAFGGLRGRFVRVGWRSRGGVRKRAGGRRVGVEDELLNGHNLFAVAELLQLAEQGLDLLNEGLSLLALQLPENLLCPGISTGASRFVSGRHLRMT